VNCPGIPGRLTNGGEVGIPVIGDTLIGVVHGVAGSDVIQ